MCELSVSDVYSSQLQSKRTVSRRVSSFSRGFLWKMIGGGSGTGSGAGTAVSTTTSGAAAANGDTQKYGEYDLCQVCTCIWHSVVYLILLQHVCVD